MADRKISDLTALTAPASGDYLPIVDISEASAANKNKRITVEELLRGAPDGTAAAPSIGFESDPNSGLYSAGADQVAISTNGVERVEFGTSEVVFNDGGANYDFRIEGDTDSSLFFVDASTDRVGIGTTAPAVKFAVSDGTGRLQCDVGSSGVELRSKNEANSTDLLMQCRASYFIWEVSGSQKMQLDTSGRLLVGTSTALTNIYTSATATTPQIQLSGAGLPESSLSLVRTGTTGATLFLNAGSSGNNVIDGSILGRHIFNGFDGTNYRTGGQILCQVDGTPGADDMPGRLVFSTTADGASSSTERLRITSAGVLQIADAGNITVGTTTGTKIGTATTQKLGFYNATPVVQPTAVADATDAASVITQLNALLSRMRNLGLIAT